MDKIVNIIRFYLLNCASIFLICLADGQNINAAFAIGYMIYVILYVPIYTFMISIIDAYLCKYRILNKWYKSIIYSFMPWMLLVIYEHILWSLYNPIIPKEGNYAAPWYCNTLYIIPIFFVICSLIGVFISLRNKHKKISI